MISDAIHMARISPGTQFVTGWLGLHGMLNQDIGESS